MECIKLHIAGSTTQVNFSKNKRLTIKANISLLTYIRFAIKSVVFFHYSDDKTTTQQAINWYIKDETATTGVLRKKIDGLTGKGKAK